MKLLLSPRLQSISRFTTMLLLICTASFSKAQTTYTAGTSSLTVSGTSTLHDWDMKSSSANCQASFAINASGQLTALSTLTFSTPVAALKSEHNAMDKNAYKALKKDNNPNIAFALKSATITTGTEGNYNVKCLGTLTIAGKSVETDLIATCKLNADKTITVLGTKKISMKDYGVEPPSFMFGSVKTGNDIVLSFNLALKK